MKILFLSHKFYPEVGGIEVNSEILAKAFHEAGHEVRLLTWTEDPENKVYPFSIKRNPGLFSLIREHQWADVVFENNPSLRLAWPAFFFKKPIVVALRTWISRVDGKIAWQDKLKTWWLKRAAGVIAVSEAVKVKCWPLAKVIGNPYRNELFRIIPEIEKTKDFVFLGRLVSDKGADLAIQALAKVIGKGRLTNIPDFERSLTIIGDGPELEMLRELVVNEKIADKVIFTGALKGEALVRCLNTHRFLIVPSVWEEPFGNVALEGMACGCVPIVSDGGGLVDAVGKAGLVFKRNSIDDLTDCMSKVMNEPVLERKLRAEATLHLAAHHPVIVAKRYLSVIENAI